MEVPLSYHERMTRTGWSWLAVAIFGATALLSFATHVPDAVRTVGGDASGPGLALYRTRRSASDLELGGDLAGVPRGQTRFVSLAELQTLPQETDTVSDDANFGRTVRLRGIALAKLPALLGAVLGASMMTAICIDGYAAHYPAAYLRAHHPLLVLQMNGKPPAQWPSGEDGIAMGPYLISHPDFLPAFRVLSHSDEPQIPWGVVRLDFQTEQQVYAPIAPFGRRAEDPLVRQGYLIARQNCFRCHSRWGEGGEKSNRPWDVVARRAATDPQYFDAYVRQPRSLNPASQMAASPGYDDATLRALRAYFNLFAGSSS